MTHFAHHRQQRQLQQTTRPRGVLLTVVAMGLVAALSMLSAPTVGASDVGRPTTDLEAEFLAHLNRIRAEHGLGSLSAHGELTTASRNWSAHLASINDLAHESDLSRGLSADWRRLGENVGTGPEVAAMMQAFMNSPAHKKNILEPGFTHVGIGVVISGKVMFTTHRFMELMPAPAPPPPPAPAPPVAPPPPPTPIEIPVETTTTIAPTTTTTVPPTTTTTTTTTLPPPPETRMGPIDDIPSILAAAAAESS